MAWALGVAGFLWLIPGIAAMQPVTAVLFVLSGAALFLASSTSSPALPRLVLAASVLLVSLMTIFQYVFDVDLGMDRLLFTDAIMAQEVPVQIPGRMAEPTATSFLLIAISLLTARTRNTAARIVYALCVTSVLFIITIVLLGYIFRIDPLTSIFGFFYVAIFTAAGLAVLSVGLLALRPDLGWVRLLVGNGVGPSAARRVLPLVIVVPVGVAWLANQGVAAGYYPQEIRLVLVTTVTLGLLFALTIWAASRLSKLEAIRRTEEALRDTERRLQAVLNNASVSILTMDERHHCSYMNLAAEKMTGYKFAETLGRPLHDVVHHTRPDGSHFPLEECPIDRAFPENHQEQGEETFVHRDGSFYRVFFTASPLLDEQGKAVGTIIEARNIEQERALEEQLRHVQRMDAVGQLTGGVAHDFNNLLAIILGNLDLLQEQLSDGTDAAELADEAVAAAVRGAELVRRLLAFSRKQHLQPAAINLNDRLSAITPMLQRTLGETIKVQVEASQNLWPALVDPAQVDDALLNMAINARDAMPDGGTLTIQSANVRLDEDYTRHELEVEPGDYVMLAISDSGAGMPSDVLGHAFEPFFTTKQEGKGSGLGLSQVYGWVKQSRGHLKIYSEVGHGTTVKIYLPRAQVLEAETKADKQSDMLGGDETIFVVEDNVDVRRTVARQLADLGYSTLEAENGPIALEMVRNGAVFDLLLTDVIMPGGMTGFQLAEQIRAIHPDLKVVFSSGYTDITTAGGHPEKHGRLLGKPFRKQDVARAIRAELDST